MGHNSDGYRIERRPFQDTPDLGWSIRRAPTDRTLKVVCLSSDFFGVRTHYFRGRTTPCRTDGCEACIAKQLSRWNGYFLAVDTSDDAPIVFEFTPPGAATIDKAIKEFGTARGLCVVATRANGRANGKVTLTVKGMSPHTHKLPAEVETWPVLARIWGLTVDASPKQASFQLDQLSNHEVVNLHGGGVGAGQSAAELELTRQILLEGGQKSMNGHERPKVKR